MMVRTAVGVTAAGVSSSDAGLLEDLPALGLCLAGARAAAETTVSLRMRLRRALKGVNRHTLPPPIGVRPRL